MKKKLLITLILLLVLSVLCVYFANNYEYHLEHPSTGAILSNYPEGEMVAVSGEVTAINGDGFEIVYEYHGKQVKYKIISNSSVNLGDQVSVLGILGPSFQIKSLKNIVRESWKYDFLIVRSALGFIVLIIIFRRYWRFDCEKMEVIRRR